VVVGKQHSLQIGEGKLKIQQPIASGQKARIAKWLRSARRVDFIDDVIGLNTREMVENIN